MAKSRANIAEEIIHLIRNSIISPDSGLSDEEMIDALEEIVFECDGAIDAKRAEIDTE